MSDTQPVSPHQRSAQTQASLQARGFRRVERHRPSTPFQPSKPYLNFTLIGFMTVMVLVMAYNNRQLQNTIPEATGPLAAHLPIYAGEVHYARIPWEYWEHRIQMIKAMGLNTLSVYVFWNYHEVEKGKFDFETENKNLPAFLELAKKHEMKVLIRPGPYVCAQWDFGGLPARLLGMPVKIRSNTTNYMSQVQIYFNELAKVLEPFWAPKGPIILLQIENELGSYTSDRKYTNELINMWRKLGVEAELYVQDGKEYYHKNYVKGLHLGLSGGVSYPQYFDILKGDLWEKGRVLFGGEIYAGWLTHWGEEWNGKDTPLLVRELTWLLSFNRSFSLYMAHGGSNFGLTAGANGFDHEVYMPHITSYDYDAPITEQGRATEKFHQIRSIFEAADPDRKLPDLPADLKAINVSAFNLSVVGSMWQNLPEQPDVIVSKVVPFESEELKMYDQGMAVYSTELYDERSYQFKVDVRDYAMVYMNNKGKTELVTTIFRNIERYYTFEVTCKHKPCILYLLVEAMGHINYGSHQDNDRKGLVSIIETSVNESVVEWNITKVPINKKILEWQEGRAEVPVLLQGQMRIEQLGDTYLDFSSFGKGYVWVNDRLLGRYWSIGPQQRIFCPKVWLKPGVNKVFVVQLKKEKVGPLEGFETLI